MADVQLTSLGYTPTESVKQFGAVGNGVADDTAAIQAAIDAVSSGGGGRVFIPAGVYIISASINFKANVLVEGEFGGTMIEMADNTDINGMFVSSGPIPFFGLRDVILNGNRNGQSGGGWAGTSVGIRLAHATTSPGFGGASLIGSGNEINDPYARIENVVIVAVDGDGLQGSGAAIHCRNIIIIGCHGCGFSNFINDAEWWGCTAGGCAEEGWVCAAGSGRYYGCKAFFVGTGFDPNAGTYGNYALGAGFRITNRFQFFVGCEGQDTDGPAFRIQHADGNVMLSGCYSSQGCNLIGQSGNIGQTPLRGGGWSGTRCGFEISNGSDHNVMQGLVRDRVLAINPGAGFDPDLDCAVHVADSGCVNNLIAVGGNPAVLDVGMPWVENNGTSTNILHNFAG
jgi:hypothetical protein